MERFWKGITKVVVDHVDEDDRCMIDRATQSQIGTELGHHGGWLINESGLYSLISSPPPSAIANFMCAGALGNLFQLRTKFSKRGNVFYVSSMCKRSEPRGHEEGR